MRLGLTLVLAFCMTGCQMLSTPHRMASIPSEDQSISEQARQPTPEECPACYAARSPMERRFEATTEFLAPVVMVLSYPAMVAATCVTIITGKGDLL